jgi:recombination-promoting nuclease RpnB
MLYYIFIEGDVREFEQFLKILIEQTKDETYKEGAMTIADHLREEGYKKGIHAGIEQGIEKGEHDAKLAIANNMLAKNSDINFVREVTGLSDQDLAKLSKNH